MACLRMRTAGIGEYNTERTRPAKCCFGKIPYQTSLDSKNGRTQDAGWTADDR